MEKVIKVGQMLFDYLADDHVEVCNISDNDEVTLKYPSGIKHVLNANYVQEHFGGCIPEFKPSESVEDRKSDGTKLSNPKDAMAANKLPLSLVPRSLMVYAAAGFAEGAAKYGANNWREAGVRFSVYADAFMRHLFKLIEGEDCDPETGVPHLASIACCTGILIDAKENGKLVDDRPPSMNLNDTIKRMENIVKGVRELHKDKNPKHYTIADTK